MRPETIHGQGFTEVVFRRPFAWLRLFWIVLMLAAWLFGILFALLLLGANEERAMVFGAWLVAWILGGLLVIYVMLWRALGVESLIARPDALTLKRRLLLLNSTTTVPASAITDIAWEADDPTRRVRVNGRRIPQPGIAVAAGAMGVLRCASGIGEAAAASAIGALRQRLPTRWARP